MILCHIADTSSLRMQICIQDIKMKGVAERDMLMLFLYSRTCTQKCYSKLNVGTTYMFINLYCLDLIPHLQGQALQFLASQCLFFYVGDIGRCEWPIWAVSQKCNAQPTEVKVATAIFLRAAGIVFINCIAGSRTCKLFLVYWH